MKYYIIALALLAATPSMADEMSAAEFFHRDKANDWKSSSPYGFIPSRNFIPQDKHKVAQLITWAVSQDLGPGWQNIALKLVKIESNYNCNAVGPKTKQGRAVGLFQIMPKTAIAMGMEPAKLKDCSYNIQAGVEHMRRCIASGVTTERDMAACHVAGWGGWNIRLARRPERYKQQYIRLAMR
jgi:hypothetical protein